MKKIVPSLALMAVISNLSANALAAETTVLTINGMVCAFCAQGIEKRLSALPATKAMYIDLAKKVVAVEARDGQVNDLARITAEITQAGYSVAKSETTSQTAADVRAAMKDKK